MRLGGLYCQNGFHLSVRNLTEIPIELANREEVLGRLQANDFVRIARLRRLCWRRSIPKENCRYRLYALVLRFINTMTYLKMLFRLWHGTLPSGGGGCRDAKEEPICD